MILRLLPMVAAWAALNLAILPAKADSPAGGGIGGGSGASAGQASQEEIIRRQEMKAIAEQAMVEGRRLERNGDLKGARRQYAFAVANLGHSPATAQLGNQAKASLVRVNFKLYQVAKEEGSTNDAYVVLKEILMVDPGNKKAQEMLDLLREYIQNGPIGAVLGNPAVNPLFVRRVKEVEESFNLAAQYKNTGQYPEAQEQLDRIISLDQYNKRAAEEDRKITKKLQFIANEARDATRRQRLLEVEQNWGDIPAPANVLNQTPGSQVPLVRLPAFETRQKLENIELPDVTLSNASIEDAAALFMARSREFDPAQEGISFVVRPEAAASAQRFDLSLRNVPLIEALRYTTQMAGVKFKVEEFAVVIVPPTEETGVLLDRTYNVPPNFFAVKPADDEPDDGLFIRRRTVAPTVTIGGSRGAVDAKAQLASKGIVFPAGATAVYYPESGVLQVKNTQDQLEIIEAIALAQTEPTYMVDVEVKLVEISQRDINELTFNYALDSPQFPLQNALFGFVPNIDGIPNSNPTAAVETALRGSQGFDVGSLNALLGQSGPPIPNVFNISGALTNELFNIVITSLAQKKSFDLLSSPSVRVENSGEATINSTRTFFFPTEFDPPETATQDTNATVTIDADFGPPSVVPAFPTEFETRDLGVKLTVKPLIGADNRTIDLALFPEIVEFDGFIDYGTPIFISSTSGPVLLSNNEIVQPVFSTRRVNTRVFVEDSHTVVLGGLIRDDVQIIDDKVPFFGDLPLIGRLFQSKAEETQKTNLLIFVTCRIYLNNGELLNPPELPPAILPGSSDRLLQLEAMVPAANAASPSLPPAAGTSPFTQR